MVCEYPNGNRMSKCGYGKAYMMNEKQMAWTKSKCNELKQYIDKHFPLSDEQWESVVNYIEKIVNLSKGSIEVRAALFDLVEPYQKKAEELMRANGHNQD